MKWNQYNKEFSAFAYCSNIYNSHDKEVDQEYGWAAKEACHQT